MDIPDRAITQEGDILICVRNGSRQLIGKCALIDLATAGSAFGAFMAVLRSSSSTFLFHQFQSNILKRQISDRMGATINQITNKDMAEFQVIWPRSVAEQQAIAEALSDTDALIESLEQLLAKKRQIKQGAMQELLTGHKRLPGFAGDWKVKRLGELAVIQRGASPRPIDSPVWFDENSAVGWVRISDVTQAGMYLTETTQRLSAQGIQNSRPVANGSLIMSICATVGKSVITKIDTCIHDGFVVFDRLNADQMFLYYTLSSIEGDWSRHGQTGSQMNLNTALINSTEVPVPPAAEEQTAIATLLSDMDAELAAVEAKLAKARSLKQGMMQELLTGRIRLV
jgi:type I restriction enzyme S subunit